jgi:hypothetical protein
MTQTFEEWKACITSGGGIRTKDAVQKRVAVLGNPDHPETKRFVETYGSDHLKQVLLWLHRLEREL